MRTLVTGADGFVGGWLIAHLEEHGDEVWRASGRTASAADARNRTVDVRDPKVVDEMLAWARPDAIYHLAAVAFGPDARRAVGQAFEVTVRGTANLLEAAGRLDPAPLVLIPSSSEIYGIPVDRQPITEGARVAPANSYGATKLAQEALALAYHHAGHVPVVVTRAFNHIGPGQREVFVVPSFALQLARIANGAAPPVMKVGNLDAERDFTDVRDVVRAYRLLVAGGHTGEPLNVARGEPTAIRTVLESLIAQSGTSVEVEVDQARLRAVDAPAIVGDASRLRALTGWRPEITLEATLADVWADAKARAV